jgi:hypothetical protein
MRQVGTVVPVLNPTDQRYGQSGIEGSHSSSTVWAVLPAFSRATLNKIKLLILPDPKNVMPTKLRLGLDNSKAVALLFPHYVCARKEKWFQGAPP